MRMWLKGRSGFLEGLVVGAISFFYMGSIAVAGALSFPESGVKAPYSPLAIPTYFQPIDVSLEALLDQHYTIISAHEAGGEEIVVLARKEGPMEARLHAICALTMPNVETDQTVVTSRCWALNHPRKGE
ncbi:hypothetical protein [Bombella pollinis]|uniref:Uncharacterized protein n=1 Tax=Bombella pollinis TaxID=2967337 RepID=A0ABT3WIA7_9PROT|nr:hypothetical protein [Bombella pollinis]MCT6856108.1 hypothetical protein [Bombella apis]MCX5618835.1 hypothetical protein [Bombella pollinis]